ncbi:unnamed protein product [Durusdinium trenchii]|uniref:Ion transport domain-containing protein n=1 Tax=Durusdinium trenchii TaxID=1381693 RepID=A0ABP0MWW9_9DINO
MMEMEELKEELRQLRVSFREDLRQEFRTQEAKLKELLKGQAVVAQSPGWSNSNAPSKDLSDLAEELDLHDEFLLPPGVPHLEGAGAALARQHSPGTAWVGSSTNKEDWRKLLSVTPEQSGPTALEQDLPGLVGDPHPPPEKDRKKEKRHSILKQGKDKDDEFKDIRMKGGVFGAGNDKDLRLDEDVYDVRNFYKKTGCAQAVARSDRFERLTLMVISINAVYIGVDADNNNASSMVDAAWPYVVFDNMFCAFFTAELLIRFGAFAVKRNCLKDRWFVFDSLLVALMVAETWVLTIVVLAMGSMEGGMPTGPLRLLRLLRLSRLVRLLKAMPELLS